MPVLSKKHIHVHDDGIYNVDQSVTVCEQHGFDVTHYLAGRCHLMALVMAQVSDFAVGVVIDEYAFEDDDGEPRMALDHAFCHLHSGNDLVDARGVRGRKELLNEFCANSSAPAEIGGDEAKTLLESWIREGLLVDFLPGEREAIAKYVKSMMDHNLLMLHDFDANPPEYDELGEPPSFFF